MGGGEGGDLFSRPNATPLGNSLSSILYNEPHIFDRIGYDVGYVEEGMRRGEREGELR